MRFGCGLELQWFGGCALSQLPKAEKIAKLSLLQSSTIRSSDFCVHSTTALCRDTTGIFYFYKRVCRLFRLLGMLIFVHFRNVTARLLYDHGRAHGMLYAFQIAGLAYFVTSK